MSWGDILQILDAEMAKPELYGWFHITSLLLTLLLTMFMCIFRKSPSHVQIRKIVFVVAIVVILLEVYKQINYSFTFDGSNIAFRYQWYVFPWQFCSMPMYVGFLAGITQKDKVHDSLYAFLATYAVFAGLCVMAYPSSVFVKTIGINIQTMVCHGSMIAVGIYLLYNGYVTLEHKTILKALPVFLLSAICAVIMNEIAHFCGLLQEHNFNMFFISPYCEPSLPIYSQVQSYVEYPWCLAIYIVGFTAAAYLILLAAMGIKYFLGGNCVECEEKDIYSI